MSRFKTLFGPKLSARRFDNQRVEAIIKCEVLNRMLSRGMPAVSAIASIQTGRDRSVTRPECATMRGHLTKRKNHTPRAIRMAARGEQRPFPAALYFLLCPVEAYSQGPASRVSE